MVDQPPTLIEYVVANDGPGSSPKVHVVVITKRFSPVNYIFIEIINQAPTNLVHCLVPEIDQNPDSLTQSTAVNNNWLDHGVFLFPKAGPVAGESNNKIEERNAV